MQKMLIVNMLLFTLHHASAQNASISTPQNILYNGVYNRLQIQADSVPCNDLIVKSNTWRIIRHGCNFDFLNTGYGPVTINLFRLIDGDKSVLQGTQTFQTADAAQPVFKIGSGRPRVPAVEFKHQEWARIEVPGRPELKFTIEKFNLTILPKDSSAVKSITNSGSRFTSETQAFLQMLRPEDQLIVNGIRAKDESSESISIRDAMFALY